MEASSGANAAVSVTVPPAATLFSEAVTEMRVTGWITATRYRIITAGSSALAMVSRVSPFFWPVTPLLFTFRISGFSAVSVTFLFFTLFGITDTGIRKVFFTGITSTGSSSVFSPTSPLRNGSLLS